MNLNIPASSARRDRLKVKVNQVHSFVPLFHCQSFLCQCWVFFRLALWFAAAPITQSAALFLAFSLAPAAGDQADRKMNLNFPASSARCDRSKVKVNQVHSPVALFRCASIHGPDTGSFSASAPATGHFKKSSYVSLIPVSRFTCGFQPSANRRELSISFRGVPSGLVVSHTISP